MERITRINDCKIELKRCSNDEVTAMLMAAIERKEDASREIEELEDDIRRRIALIDLQMEEVA